MNEHIIIKGKTSELNIVTVFLGVISLVLWLEVPSMSQGLYYFSMQLSYALTASILTAIAYLILSRCSIVVTDKRIYGRVIFGRQVDLPLDSVSAVATTSFLTRGISVSTSSGRITFFYQKNRKDVAEKIRELLIQRQDKESATIKQEAYSSDASELKRFKELLDSGVITQEEFDAKKKQLLGL